MTASPALCISIVAVLALLTFQATPSGAATTTPDPVLTASEASHFAALVLKSVHREYPNKLDHLVNEERDIRSPKALHPAFYGCFDWHSSVHGHWLLVRLLRMFPALPEAARIRSVLAEDLTRENILAETTYFNATGRQSYERTYGWSWLLKLDEELLLYSKTDADARKWHEYLQPLSRTIVAKFLDFLPKQNYPIRTGVHPNTAFGLALALDYANAAGEKTLQHEILSSSRRYYSNDKNYPANWEPGGEDFLSPALTEADLMRRVLEPAEFRTWFGKFLPGLSKGDSALLKPAVVLDRSDPKLVHLDGLNLSRAWCMKAIADALPSRDTRRHVLLESANKHLQQALPYVASGDYVGEHWLATFAIYALTAEALK